MFLSVYPGPAEAVGMSDLSDDSNEFILNQSLLFPNYVPDLDVVKSDLENFIAEVEVLKGRLQKTHDLYLTYRNDTEEEGLSKQIFYDHIRHLQKVFMSLLGYIKNGRRVTFTEEQRSDREIIFSLVANLGFGFKDLDSYVEGISRRFLELSLPRHSYPSTTSKEQLPTINKLVFMSCRIPAISRKLARSYWENQITLHLEDNDPNILSWGPTLTTKEFEAMLNMP